MSETVVAVHNRRRCGPVNQIRELQASGDMLHVIERRPTVLVYITIHFQKKTPVLSYREERRLVDDHPWLPLRDATEKVLAVVRVQPHTSMGVIAIDAGRRIGRVDADAAD